MSCIRESLETHDRIAPRPWRLRTAYRLLFCHLFQYHNHDWMFILYVQARYGIGPFSDSVYTKLIPTSTSLGGPTVVL